MNEPLWTVVQHSAWAYGRNPQFRRGLETAAVTSNKDRRTVEMAGGLFFTDYLAAENYAHKACYPEGYTGMIPLCPGQFSTMAVDGRAVYVPVPVAV